ncbi:MAG: sugar phosphate isomerase/epimerase [Oscillospiraceae bacterium]
MKIGISTACYYPQYLEKTIDMIGKSGIKNIELFVNTESELDDKFINYIKSLFDFYGITPVSLHPFTSAYEPFLLFTDYERRFQDGINLYKRYFETMNKLSIQFLILHGDKLGSSSTEELYFDHFGRLCDVATQHGVTIAQENVYKYKSGEMYFIQKLVHNFPNIALAFDNKQALRAGIDSFEFIDKFGNNIKHIHLSDNGANGDCLPFGEGSVDFGKMLIELKKHNFDGTIMLELYRKSYNNFDDLYKSIEILKNYKSFT